MRDFSTEAICCRCKYYGGVHEAIGHASCNSYSSYSQTVMWDGFCSNFTPWRTKEKEMFETAYMVKDGTDLLADSMSLDHALLFAKAYFEKHCNHKELWLSLTIERYEPDA